MIQGRVFVDTGAYFALFSTRDFCHVQALSTWEMINFESIPITTSNHVIDELATLLGRKNHYQFSASKIRKIYSSRIEILRSTEEDEKAALNLFEKFADQQVSFTDCLSFALMKREKIHFVFTFDQHFQFAGFDLLP